MGLCNESMKPRAIKNSNSEIHSIQKDHQRESQQMLPQIGMKPLINQPAKHRVKI